ncbi:MAG: polyprenyl synthetase family protein [Candidatus Eremiobacteraeota bacterium]|nr:polyprenyl synthetase family protein [Candidatus Eremiobacteraeota bacterium]
MEAVRDDADLYARVENFFRSTFSTDNALITEAVKRMLAAGGKRLRPRMTLLAASACGDDSDEHLHLAAYMELIHVATLIHDDVVDNASTRRGVNSTAIDYGNRVSVLAGDYLFAWIFKNVTANYTAPIPHILSATLAAICDGEVLQLRSLGVLDLPLETYIEVARKKTASLFAASAECGAIAAGASTEQIEALRTFGDLYGIAFQMKDDLLDVTADAAAIGKPVGNDLHERKMTIPLILALETGDTELRARVEKYYEGEGGEADVPAIVAEIARVGGLGSTRRQIADFVARAKAALAPMGASGAKTELEELADALAAD